jgi:DNA-directed RNA polymerase subunit RPC12/RpoP
MDLVFHCTHCKQELSVDASGAGSNIECPSCGAAITIPEPDSANIRTLNPIAASAAAREEKHFVVPVHDTPSEVLVEKPVRPLDAIARDGTKKIRTKCYKRSECVEVGHDRFDDVVTEFLQKVGEDNIISINTLTYTHLDIGSQKLLTDYGVMIVYRG